MSASAGPSSDSIDARDVWFRVALIGAAIGGIAGGYLLSLVLNS